MSTHSLFAEYAHEIYNVPSLRQSLERAVTKQNGERGFTVVGMHIFTFVGKSEEALLCSHESI